MILKHTTDPEIIKSILFDEDIWDRISEDGQEKEGISDTALASWLWFVFEVDEKSIGMFGAHNWNTTTVQIHIHILKAEREKYAVQAGLEIIKWFKTLPPRINKLIAEIPAIYQDVYYFTKKFGFVDEGINRKSFTKNGIIIDQYILGITKEEAGE